MKLPAWLGKTTYILAYPAIRVAVWRSHRAYVVLLCNEQVLLTKNWMGLQRVWRLPGGGVHKTESSEVAAMRELHEELGVTVPRHELRKLNDVPLRASGGYTYDVFVWNLSSKPTKTSQRLEILETTWLDISLVNVRCSEHVLAASKLLSVVY